jgi:hypothetical protein
MASSGADVLDDTLPITALPWNTGPSGEGRSYCEWCGRHVYRPAQPCSVQPIPGIAAIPTLPGYGERCKWEARTRAALPLASDLGGPVTRTQDRE